VRVARALGLALATEALPSADSGLDPAAASRRALLVSIQLGLLLVAGLPLVVVTQPFLPSFPWAIVLAVAVLALALPFWRGATNLHGHVRAGAQVILEAAARQGQATGTKDASASDVARLVPGIGDATVVRIDRESTGMGQTLKQMNLRGQTGASVIAIEHEGGETVYPTADDVLRAGDTLVLTGTKEAVGAARQLLTSGAGAPDSDPNSAGVVQG
jgi:CPA2 family monovalent cation:H+ antiporter-2